MTETKLNTSKIQNILPKIKTYSLCIKIGLQGKRNFKSFLYTTDFTVRRPILLVARHLIPRTRILVY